MRGGIMLDFTSGRRFKSYLTPEYFLLILIFTIVPYYILIGTTAKGQSNPIEKQPSSPPIKKLVNQEYSLYEFEELYNEINGIEYGELQILVDKRILDPRLIRWERFLLIRERTLDYGQDQEWFNTRGQLLKSFRESLEKAQLKNSVLRLVDGNGRVLEKRELKGPYAEIDKTYLYSDNKPTYIISEDLTASMGSWNGPVSTLIEIKNGKIKELEYRSAKSDQKNHFFLMRALKSDWRIIDSGKGKGKEILSVHMERTYDEKTGELGELIRYRRYSFNGDEWIKLERTEEGWWESVDGFPNLSKFPKQNK